MLQQQPGLQPEEQQRHAQAQLQFAQWLLRLGNGTERTYPDVGEGMIKIPEGMCAADQGGNALDAFINEVLFPGDQYAAGSAILVAKNDTVDQINEKAMKIFPGVVRTMQALYYCVYFAVVHCLQRAL